MASFESEKVKTEIKLSNLTDSEQMDAELISGVLRPFARLLASPTFCLLDEESSTSH